jgi:hypothetical protein
MKPLNNEQLDLLAQSLSKQLDNVDIPDITEKVLASRRTKSATVFTLKRFAVAAAILLSSLNGGILWYSWNYSQELNQTELIDSLYSTDSDWTTLLTLNE